MSRDVASALTMYVCVTSQFEFVDHMSSPLRKLLQGLIQPDLTQRLGCLRAGVADIKRHDWFADTDWLAIYYKQVCAKDAFLSKLFVYIFVNCTSRVTMIMACPFSPLVPLTSSTQLVVHAEQTITESKQVRALHGTATQLRSVSSLT